MDYFRRRNTQTDKGRRKFYTIQSTKHQRNRHPCRGLYSRLAFISIWHVNCLCTCFVEWCAKHILEARIYVFRKALSCLWSKSHSHNLPPAQLLFVPRQWSSLQTPSFCASPLKGRDFLCLRQSFVWSPNWGVGRSVTNAVKLKVSMLWDPEDLSCRMRDIQPLLLYNYLGFLFCRPTIKESLTTKSLRFQQNWCGGNATTWCKLIW
jgi:hypothetical protein